MSNIQHRHQGEDAAHPDATKANATAGNRGAADRANQTDQHSTVEQSRETERGLYLPLAWAQLGRESKPQKFKGKAKRQARAAAINAKRMGGTIAAELAGLIALALVAGALLLGVLA